MIAYGGHIARTEMNWCGRKDVMLRGYCPYSRRHVSGNGGKKTAMTFCATRRTIDQTLERLSQANAAHCFGSVPDQLNLKPLRISLHSAIRRATAGPVFKQVFLTRLSSVRIQGGDGGAELTGCGFAVASPWGKSQYVQFFACNPVSNPVPFGQVWIARDTTRNAPLPSYDKAGGAGN